MAVKHEEVIEKDDDEEKQLQHLTPKPGKFRGTLVRYRTSHR